MSVSLIYLSHLKLHPFLAQHLLTGIFSFYSSISHKPSIFTYQPIFKLSLLKLSPISHQMELMLYFHHCFLKYKTYFHYRFNYTALGLLVHKSVFFWPDYFMVFNKVLKKRLWLRIFPNYCSFPRFWPSAVLASYYCHKIFCRYRNLEHKFCFF